jgi:hypothetical protein
VILSFAWGIGDWRLPVSNLQKFFERTLINCVELLAQGGLLASARWSARWLGLYLGQPLAQGAELGGCPGRIGCFLRGQPVGTKNLDGGGEGWGPGQPSAAAVEKWILPMPVMA